MTVIHYEPDMSMRDARAQYFAANSFGEKGGYEDTWVAFHIGPVPFPFPNTASRIRAVKVHDLHHVLTGYDTNFVGETEIAAWELGAGCKDFAAAWGLNLAGLAGGMLVAPKRSFRAFIRGMRSDSLYGHDLDNMLDVSVATLRARVGEVDKKTPADLREIGLFAIAVGASVVAGIVFAALGVVLAPIGIVVGMFAPKTVQSADGPLAR